MNLKDVFFGCSESARPKYLPAPKEKREQDSRIPNVVLYIDTYTITVINVKSDLAALSDGCKRLKMLLFSPDTRSCLFQNPPFSSRGLLILRERK